MRTSIVASSLVFVGVFGVAGTASGAIVSANLPGVNNAGLATGYFSDAYASDGGYYNGQTVAVSITANASYNLTQLTFWGYSENFFQAGLGNVAGFQVQILSADFNTVVVNHAWSLGELAIQATGNIGDTGGIEYQFAGLLDHELNAGTYWLNIGVVAKEGDDDGWIWTTGMMPNAPIAAAFVDVGGGWGPWNTFDTSGSGSHILFGQIIPSPGALALLAMGGLVSRRRR